MSENKFTNWLHKELKQQQKQEEIEKDRQLSLEFNERWKQNAF